MACSYTGTAEMFVGFMIDVAAAGIFLSKSDDALRWSALTVFSGAISVLLLPQAIGYCHSSSMPCHYGTVPALRLFGVITLVASLTGFLVTFRKTGGKT